MLASAALAAVAAAGVLRPFGRPVQPVEPFSEAGEDERVSVLRALRDLEQDHLYGAVDDAEYVTLRAEAEARAVATLKSFDLTRPSPATRAVPPSDPSLGRRRTPGSFATRQNGHRTASRRTRRAATVLIAGVVVGVITAVLASSLRTRTPEQPISGDLPGARSNPSGSPFAFFEQRVRDHPRDLAARLDLAQRYLDAGRVRPAIDQYLAALQIDPRNTEARAKLGFLIYRAGRPEDGLRIVDQALAADRTYPEALFFKGVILLRGVHHPGEAAEAFRSYLRAAPFGSRRAEAQSLLAEAERSP
jgi:cytochrome c-type biogenesis protein CcmH/NrfG